MPRPSSSPARASLWLDLVDNGWSMDQIALAAGVTRQRVQQRLAEARQIEPEQDRPEVGDADTDWLELRDAVPEGGSSHPWYRIGTKEEQLTSGQGDETSHDGTTSFVFVGTGRGGTPRRNRLGTGRHVDMGQSQAGTSGLKGGKG